MKFKFQIYLSAWPQASWNKPNLKALQQAVKEQLGLEPVPGKYPVETLVIGQSKAGSSR